MESNSTSSTGPAKLVASSQIPLCPPDGAGPIDPTTIRGNLWAQGSVCAPEFVHWLRRNQLARPSAASALWTPSSAAHETVAVVVSQDCDIVNARYDAEPFVEVILCEPIARLDSLYVNGHHPRRFDFEIENNGGNGEVYAALASERYFIPRWALEHCRPDSVRSLAADDLVQLVTFVVNRYIRAALPDAFNERRRKGSKRIAGVLKRAAGDFASVFIELDSTDELPEAQDYQVEVFFVLDEKQYADETVQKRATRTHVPDFRAALDACPGITVTKAMVVSVWGVSVADRNHWFAWPMAD